MGIFDNFVYKEGEIVDNNWVKLFVRHRLEVDYESI